MTNTKGKETLEFYRKLAESYKDLGFEDYAVAELWTALASAQERIEGIEKAAQMALHYTSCYALQFPNSGANWAEEEMRDALASNATSPITIQEELARR